MAWPSPEVLTATKQEDHKRRVAGPHLQRSLYLLLQLQKTMVQLLDVLFLLCACSCHLQGGKKVHAAGSGHVQGGTALQSIYRTSSNLPAHYAQPCR